MTRLSSSRPPPSFSGTWAEVLGVNPSFSSRIFTSSLNTVRENICVFIVYHPGQQQHKMMKSWLEEFLLIVGSTKTFKNEMINTQKSKWKRRRWRPARRTKVGWAMWRYRHTRPLIAVCGWALSSASEQFTCFLHLSIMPALLSCLTKQVLINCLVIQYNW